MAMDEVDVELERDGFVRQLIGELAAVLQDVIGSDEASGFVSLVGRTMGRDLGARYRQALGGKRLGRDEVESVLVDLKRRIQGGFSVQESTPERLTLVNHRCPFGEAVEGRPALCMMTSNVFGTITSENLGYARVHIEEAIARGDGRCLVHVVLALPNGEGGLEGQEYFGDVHG
jgi:predicted ArsR family transcriptional regulator